MSVVNVTSVEVGQNPAPLYRQFRFEVIFECLERLEADLDWKLIYVGSSNDKSYDQELDCVVMGPVNRGVLKFALEAEAPDFSKIPPDDIHGFTIILLTGAYRDEEFVRIGWYIHNVYTDTELQEFPPELPQLDKMQRIILTEAPRVTRFKISWDNPKPLFEETQVAQPPSTQDQCEIAAALSALRADMSASMENDDDKQCQQQCQQQTDDPPVENTANNCFTNTNGFPWLANTVPCGGAFAAPDVEMS